MKKGLHIEVAGSVQGVGFRPFVYRLATQLNLTGWVMNTAQGVQIRAEGARGALMQFLSLLEQDKPALASVCNLQYTWYQSRGLTKFQILQSHDSGHRSASILPDIATCPDCLRELFTSTDRRYRYPFLNCTHCGPRFTIVRSLPYDRANTAMLAFTMCEACHEEYENPENRRFHAQPNACPVCGPRLEAWNTVGEVLAQKEDSLLLAARAIREGSILALKGIGGFQLLVDARNELAVQKLRNRKLRPHKPLALLYPSLELIRQHCHVTELEEKLLLSVAAPIVLLTKKKPSEQGKEHTIAANVAPDNPLLGAMLPYSPLHHLLLRELNFPVIATSGNLSNEPICTDEHEALRRLKGIADVYLVHNRPILRPVDDSVVHVVAGREQVLRRARGYAPLPLYLPQDVPPLLAVGGHLKNTVAIGNGSEVFVSQHIGSLDTGEAVTAFEKVITDFIQLYTFRTSAVACDLHPDYLSTRYAHQLGLPVVAVQHHFAHVLSCMADHEIEGPVLGVAWDGTGLGTDGTLWGGECLLTSAYGFERVAHFRTFRLPGGEACIKEPKRTALGLMYEIFGEEVFERQEVMSLLNFSVQEAALLRQMLHKNINSPVTSSVGRLFDGVAALIGLRQQVSFEGQAAMELEFAVAPEVEEVYRFNVLDQKPFVIDWQPMLLQILLDVQQSIAPSTIAAKFHHTLVEIILHIAQRIGESKVVLTGGCFQNKLLTELVVKRLEASGFTPFWHHRIPPNDGGLAVGQLLAVAACPGQDGWATKAVRNERAKATKANFTQESNV